MHVSQRFATIFVYSGRENVRLIDCNYEGIHFFEYIFLCASGHITPHSTSLLQQYTSLSPIMCALCFHHQYLSFPLSLV